MPAHRLAPARFIVVKKRVNIEAAASVHDAGALPLARSLAKGLDILHCFRPGETFLGNKEICERVGLPKQTVSRLTLTLVVLGYLSYAESLCKYKLGSGVLALAYPLLTSMSFRHVVRPFMADLANEMGGSVSMGLRFRNRMMFVESCTVRGTRSACADTERTGRAVPGICSRARAARRGQPPYLPASSPGGIW